MADWEEVKRLAADFQRAQLSSTKQKLSERNVIEIVAKLMELKLIDVIHTLDGKEYLTHQELAKEVQDELVIHGGRINLVDLQQILNVDFRHIEDKVTEMVKQDRSLMLVLGQLMDRNYLDSMAEEVNDKLQDKGYLTMVEITKQYDLPSDFVASHIRDRVGKIIKGKLDSQDKDVIYTGTFINRMKSQIRGALSAVTRPTTVTMVMQRYGFQERLFFSILEEHVHTGRLKGSLVGRQEKMIYIPDIYTRAQNEWVDNFYKQNGYLEYDNLVRLGISDPKTFIKKRFKSDPIVYLKRVCVGSGLIDQIEASIEEAVSTDGYSDVMPLLPSMFSEEDCHLLLQECVKKQTDAIICCDTIVTSQKYISKWKQPFMSLVTEKAEKDARSNPQLFLAEEKKGASSRFVMEEGSKEDRKDQRKKKQASSTKSGGGNQGREVKMKATKKKYLKGRGDQGGDSDEEEVSRPRHTEIQFMTVEEITEELQKQSELRDCPEDFITEIATQIQRPLNKDYQQRALETLRSTVTQSSGSGKRKTHTDLQERITGLWTNVLLFEKGTKSFPEETEVLLTKHLLKTVCSDITNIIVIALVNEHMLSTSEEEETLTPESRAKLISKLPDGVQQNATRLNSSLSGKALDEFYKQLDVLCGPEHLGILLRKPDKRKERQLIFNHRQSLLDHIQRETDPAMLLHLSVVVLFQTFTSNIIHAPGKYVPQIITFLKQYLAPESHQLLVRMQDLVIQQMKLQGEDKDSSEVTAELDQLKPQVVDVAIKTKKTSQKQEEEK
ncbi:E3 UFM1-protein ligase 1-like isoform X2 [Ostrea edulis]|uniref:E3 UFM1-protein ligase 1-like isoform X2 n=1 Tax=Ostrea edulis TaxID=37623 RepID=UPI0024AE992E|nr:E3 UFM1-protein ligase 1-like isoform X2 [Ostrea edulis]